MKELQLIVEALNRSAGRESALATLVQVAGSSYRRPGARLLLFADGERIGSISGGCLEEDLLIRMRRVLTSGVPETVVYDTTSENDLVWGVGLGCHGVVKLLVEKLPPQPRWARVLAENFDQRRATSLVVAYSPKAPTRAGTYLGHDVPESIGTRADEVYRATIPPPTRLVIYGAGDDAQPLARLASELGWRVTVADPRAAFVTKERFPTVQERVCDETSSLVAKTAPDAATLAVIMTHHYIHDVPLMRDLLPHPLAYLGLLGPRKRADKILADLEKGGLAITSEQRAQLHAPVGLDLGADAPEQVALAILAEMQATLAQRDARPLRERTRPIHE